MGEVDAKSGAVVTPTLLGRIETRLFLIWTVGLVWVLFLVPVLALLSPNETFGNVFQSSMAMLFWISVLGVMWEFVYHGLQQFRWEKDWPTMFGLLTYFNEGLLLWLVMGVAGLRPPAWIFFLAFTSTWILIWAVAAGPMRVVSLRWRFRGGRLV